MSSKTYRPTHESNLGYCEVGEQTQVTSTPALQPYGNAAAQESMKAEQCRKKTAEPQRETDESGAEVEEATEWYKGRSEYREEACDPAARVGAGRDGSGGACLGAVLHEWLAKWQLERAERKHDSKKSTLDQHKLDYCAQDDLDLRS